MPTALVVRRTATLSLASTATPLSAFAQRARCARKPTAPLKTALGVFVVLQLAHQRRVSFASLDKIIAAKNVPPVGVELPILIHTLTLVFVDLRVEEVRLVRRLIARQRQ